MSNLVSSFVHISVHDIEVGNRFREDYGDIDGLALNIKERGLIQPLAVVETKDGPKPYTLLAGGRRLAAIKKAGYKDVPVKVYCDISDMECRLIELCENIWRKDMSWQEQVKLKQEILILQQKLHGTRLPGIKGDQTGVAISDVAKMMGESAPNFHKDVKLAKMMQVVPGLEKCKNKNDAQKLLKAMEKTTTNYLAADAFSKAVATTPVDIHKQQLYNNYILRDCLSGLSTIQSNSIDLLEIDPPYAIDLVNQKKGDIPNYTLAIYNEIGEDKYLPFMMQILEEAKRVLKDSGWLILWYGMSPWHSVLYQSIIDLELKCKDTPAIWVKDGAGQANNPFQDLGYSYETFFYANKGTAKLASPGHSNIFQIKKVAPQRKIHPTEKPIELMMEIYRTFCNPGATVCIPFLGSGNGILAADNCSMHAFGYDLSEDYRVAYGARLMEQSAPYTSYPKSQGEE